MAAPPASRGACAFPELPDGLRAPPPPHFHGDQCLGGRLLPVPCAGRCRSPSLSAFEHFHLLCQSPRSSSCWTWNGKEWNPLGMEGAPSLPLAAGPLTSPTCVLPNLSHLVVSHLEGIGESKGLCGVPSLECSQLLSVKESLPSTPSCSSIATEEEPRR